MTAAKKPASTTADPTSNTYIWDELGRTDPSQTKGFARSGGFRGTAIKPIWTERRMTEFFGPCGVGWGTTEAKFHVHAAGDEMLVFSQLALWYIDQKSGNRSEPVYGVGGDKFLIKQASGMRTSDEAFKMAHTDAITNAMKHIGIAADIHMGQFDDSKYVDEMRKEFSDEPPPPPPAAPTFEPLDLEVSSIAITQAIDSAKDLPVLEDIMKRNTSKLNAMKTVRPTHFTTVVEAATKRKQYFLSQQQKAS